MPKETPRLEADVLAEVGQYLSDNYYFFWRNNNAAVYDTRKKAFRHLPLFARRGVPDYSVVFNGTFIGIEVKREGGKMRPEQEKFRDEIHAHGGIFFTVTSGKMLEELLKARGLYK